MRREALKQGTKVRIKKLGNAVYAIKYDYEDLIYVTGIKEPFYPHEIEEVKN